MRRILDLFCAATAKHPFCAATVTAQTDTTSRTGEPVRDLLATNIDKYYGAKEQKGNFGPTQERHSPFGEIDRLVTERRVEVDLVHAAWYIGNSDAAHHCEARWIVVACVT